MNLRILLPLLASFAFRASAAEKLPADARAFIEKRQGCDHMRGEVPDPTDAQRMREVSREIGKLCKGTDRRLAELKRKYAADRAIMRQLNQFETHIETSGAGAEH